ncbi:MAG TPA: glycosyltransferase [Blastocatellia bacterium]|nr:glycosyltransferase [Blastocatellia bacterium]
MPRVSVVIPTYNRAELLNETIKSVLNQSFKALEIIVVDDGSTDDTREVVSGLNGPIKYIYQENKGRSAARNRGFKLSSGEYICFLDSDDLFSLEKVGRQVELLDSHKEIGFVYSDYAFIDRSGMLLDKPLIYSRHPLQKGFILKHLLHFDFIPPSTVMVRRTCLETVGLFDSALEPAEDFDWLLRLAGRYEASYVAEPLCRIRMHGGNTPSADIAGATIQVIMKHLSLDESKAALGGDWRQVYCDCYITAANYRYNLRDMRKARQYFLKALKVSPSRALDFGVNRLILKSMLGATVLGIARRIKSSLSRAPASIQ